MPPLLRQFDVWWFDQPGSRQNSDPVQPGDPSAKNRMFVVVSPQKVLDNNGRPVCVPVGSLGRSKIFDVRLGAGEGGVLRECHIWCNELYTLERRFFLRRMGSVAHREKEIHLAIRLGLGLLS